ncbi:MAG: DUF1232 domain-containing protein [Patescibacteria group bacterium]
MFLRKIIKSLGFFKKETLVFKNVLADSETPPLAKILLGFTLAYALSPIDLVPDFIPFVGVLDDLVILPMLFMIALRFVPKEIIEKNRRLIAKK